MLISTLVTERTNRKENVNWQLLSPLVLALKEWTSAAWKSFHAALSRSEQWHLHVFYHFSIHRRIAFCSLHRHWGCCRFRSHFSFRFSNLRRTELQCSSTCTCLSLKKIIRRFIIQEQVVLQLCFAVDLVSGLVVELTFYQERIWMNQLPQTTCHPCKPGRSSFWFLLGQSWHRTRTQSGRSNEWRKPDVNWNKPCLLFSSHSPVYSSLFTE